MPALMPVPPETFRAILESKEWFIISEDQYNWIFVKTVDGFPIVVPRRVRLLPVDVMMHTLEEAEIKPGEFIDLLSAIGYMYPASPFLSDDQERARPN